MSSRIQSNQPKPKQEARGLKRPQEKSKFHEAVQILKILVKWINQLQISTITPLNKKPLSRGEGTEEIAVPENCSTTSKILHDFK